MRFHFKGKSGKTWRLQLKDRRIARVVRSIQELPGQHLFQYLDDEGVARSINSDDVNDYLREIAGPDVSAKDFRTWAGTVVMALGAIGPFADQDPVQDELARAPSRPWRSSSAIHPRSAAPATCIPRSWPATSRARSLLYPR